jgi:hypothetical protein
LIDFLYGAIVFILIHLTTINFGWTLYESRLMFSFLWFLVIMISYFACIIWWFVYNTKEMGLTFLKEVRKNAKIDKD